MPPIAITTPQGSHCTLQLLSNSTSCHCCCLLFQLCCPHRSVAHSDRLPPSPSPSAMSPIAAVHHDCADVLSSIVAPSGDLEADPLEDLSVNGLGWHKCITLFCCMCIAPHCRRLRYTPQGRGLIIGRYCISGQRICIGGLTLSHLWLAVGFPCQLNSVKLTGNSRSILPRLWNDLLGLLRQSGYPPKKVHNVLQHSDSLGPPQKFSLWETLGGTLQALQPRGWG
jgi:hypothetical protein